MTTVSPLDKFGQPGEMGFWPDLQKEAARSNPGCRSMMRPKKHLGRDTVCVSNVALRHSYLRSIRGALAFALLRSARARKSGTGR
jgi:hypothetical protein